MQQTLHALGGILLNGLPTFALVLLLNVYLRFAFFKPLEQTLAKRYELTEGARKASAAALSAADARVSDYDAKLRAERAAIYEAQEKIARSQEEKHTAALQKARADADIMLRGALASIDKEAEAVRQELFVQSELLADRIVESMLNPNFAGKAA